MTIRLLFCCLLGQLACSVPGLAQTDNTFLQVITNVKRGYTMCPAGDGNLYVGGAVIGRTALLKITPDGTVINSYFLDFDTGNLDNVTELIVDSEGMVVGCGNQGDDSLTTGFVFRYNPLTHTVLWATTLPDEVAVFQGLLERSPGDDFLVYGKAYSSIGSTALLLQVNRLSGALEIKSYHYIQGRCAAFNAVVAHDSTLYAVGEGSGLPNAGPGEDCALRSALTRLDTASPFPLWMRLSGATLQASARLSGRDLIIDGDAILSTYSGNRTDFTQPNSTFFLQKHHLDGTIEWRKEYDLPAWTNEQAEEMIAVPDGYVFYGQASDGNAGSLFVLKTDKMGLPIWANKLQFGYNDGFAQNSSQQGQIVALGDKLFFTATTKDSSGLGRMLLFKATSAGKMGNQCTYWTPTPVVLHELTDLPDTAVTITVSLEENPLIDAPHTIALPIPAVVVVACQAIALPPCDTLNLGPDVVLCRDSTVTFHAGNGFVSYLWQDGSTDSTFTTDQYGLYSVAVTDACGQTQRDSVLLTVSLLGDTPFPDTSVCAGGSLIASLPGFDTYRWMPAAALDCDTCATVTLMPLVTTQYTLLASTLSGCITHDTFLVVVIIPDTIDLGPDVILCRDSTVTFHAGSGFVTYLWQDGSTDSTFSTNQYGLYSVAVTDACGKTQRDSVLLTVSLLGDTPFPDTSVCAGKSLTVSLPGFDNYLWTPAAALNCDTCSSVVLQPITTTQYTVLATTNTGCITKDTFVVVVKPLPTRTEVIEFLPGDTVLLGGQAYTQPGIVVLTLPAQTGCDTLVSYKLQLKTMVALTCPNNLTVSTELGAPGAAVDYSLPQAVTNCPDTTLTFQLLNGMPQGGLFPVGITTTCYQVTDACGNTASCCFQVTVEEQAAPCDVKTIGCIRYELLSIKFDASGNRRYRIRVTNTCASALVYVAFELPGSYTAVAPADGSVFTSANGRKYDVRNPNYTPFRSIRFKAQAGSVLNLGASDIFEYTLPAQTAPVYIHVTAKVEPDQTYSALMNTFYCPVQPYTNFRPQGRSYSSREALTIFPNPSDGLLFADCSAWAGKTIQLHLLSAQGQFLQTMNLVAEDSPQILELPAALANGLYFIELQTASGQRIVQRFVLQR